MNKKRISIDIDIELHNRFKSFVAKDGESIKDTIIRLIEGYLNDKR